MMDTVIIYLTLIITAVSAENKTCAQQDNAYQKCLVMETETLEKQNAHQIDYLDNEIRKCYADNAIVQQACHLSPAPAPHVPPPPNAGPPHPAALPPPSPTGLTECFQAIEQQIPKCFPPRRNGTRTTLAPHTTPRHTTAYHTTPVHTTTSHHTAPHRSPQQNNPGSLLLNMIDSCKQNFTAIISLVKCTYAAANHTNSSDALASFMNMQFVPCRAKEICLHAHPQSQDCSDKEEKARVSACECRVEVAKSFNNSDQCSQPRREILHQLQESREANGSHPIAVPAFVPALTINMKSSGYTFGSPIENCSARPLDICKVTPTNTQQILDKVIRNYEMALKDSLSKSG